MCHYLLSMRHIPTRNETGWVLNWVLGRSLSACCYLHGAKTPGDTEEIHYTFFPGITFLDSPPPPSLLSSVSLKTEELGSIYIYV